MKKKLFYLFTFLCVLGAFSSCKDDDPEVPPTVEDIIAEYAADKLVVKVDGNAVAENAKVEVAKSTTDGKITIKLLNIVPGVARLDIPDAKFEAVTRSAYISTLKGQVSDNVSGYVVDFDGKVDEKILTANVTLTEIKGENVNTQNLRNLVFKGDMDITVSNLGEPVSLVQRVYTLKSKTLTSKADTSMIKLQIKNFAFQTLELGDITIDTILVQKRGDVYAFKAQDRKIKLSIGEVSANLEGTIIGEDMNLKLDIDAMGLKVGVAFEGDVAAEAKEAKITKMEINGPAVIEQKKETAKLTFKVWENTADAQLLLTPAYELSPKATIDSVVLIRKGQPTVKLTADQITGKQPIDFSLLKDAENDYVKYYIAAEDPNTKGSFSIYMERLATPASAFTFTQWNGVDADQNGIPDFYEPEGWATSNLAAVFLTQMPDPTDPTGEGMCYPANTPFPVSKEGNDAQIITVDTKGYGTLIPAITAGTMFLGKFSLDITNTLKSTKFGVPYVKEPVSFKGTYKFTAGAKYYKVKSIDPVTQIVTKEEVVGKTDSCAISAVLYEVASYDETLDGTNLYNSDKIVAVAVINSKTTNGYVNFDTPMTYLRNFDASKKYKLAVVCSSSINGAAFEGAPGSTLLVTSLEVVNK